MKPHRLTLTNHLVVGYGLHKKMEMYQPRSATKEELAEFHDEDYVDFLSRWVDLLILLREEPLIAFIQSHPG